MANEFIARKGLIALSDSQITGSLNISQNLNVVGGLTASFDSSTSTAISGAFTSVSSSIASERLKNTTDTLTGDLTVTGTITAQEFHTEFVSASIIYESGSTKFGDSSDDIHRFTGSLQFSTSSNIVDNGISHYTNGYLYVRGGANGAAMITDGSGTTTGFYANDGGTAVITTANVDRMTVSSTGNVTFAGQVLCDTNTTSPSTGDAAFYKSSAGAVLSGYQAILETGGAGSRATALTINDSQNVGIGVTSLQSWAKLQVAGTAGAQTGANQALYVTAPSTTAGEGVGIRLSAASGSNEAVGIIGMVNNASGNAGSMTFHTYNLGGDIPERMRIDNSGNVGIGTTSPIGKFNVLTGTAGISLDIANQPNGSISFVNNSGGTPVPTITGKSANNVGLVLQSTTSDTPVAGIDMIFDVRENDNTDFATLTSTAYRFARGGNSIVEIKRNGNVGIGTTSPNVKLQITGNSTNSLLLDPINSAIGQNVFFNGSAWDSVNHSVGGSVMQLGTDGSFAFRRATAADPPVLTYSMYIDSNGKVGIGLANPSYPLDVATSGNLLGRFASSGTASELQIVSPTVNVIKIDTGTSDVLAFGTTGTERMRISSAGYVGIGTNNPQTALTLPQGTGAGNKISWYDGTPTFAASIYANSSNDTLTFATKNASNVETTAMVIDLNQRVGIGTTSPSEILHTNKNSAGNIVGGYFTNSQANTGAEEVSLAFGLNRSGGDFVRQVKAITFGAEQQWTGTPSTVDGFLSFSTVADETVAERMRITSAGDVNILNTTSTDSKSIGITNAAGTTGWTFGNGVTANAHQFVIYDNTAGSPRMLINSNGNVGIGTTSPGARLHVNGVFSLNSTYHGEKVLIFGPGSAFSINLPNEFPGMALTSGNTWAVIGDMNCFGSGGTIEVRTFYIGRNSSGTWTSAQYSASGANTGASLQSVTGSSNSITINMNTGSYLTVKLTVMIR